ncbi:hypothetical protein PHYSODRAFT_335070 [Phytophthora sojae]|uniref:Uncharacterized protein n=1 Tax=Phytophthora sojae (strain P6497) TaxID=1094619 RepID=G4ZU37_PHYSP|nr:hypothetical protein PHYSODRAFT_335070 [Phytophthora sojae]EGZ13311.1 hypothetical protein PHYSODRAFT_335070 [Phytophthora sojae]|eukprot:XP_009530740.1 hypothetical protein PHYSODRAFT_335070 [Phytophthora sojae]
MVKGRSLPSWASPATAGGSLHTKPNSAGGRIADMMMEAVPTVRFGDDRTQDRGRDGNIGDYDEELKKAELLSGVAEFSLHVGRMEKPRRAQQNLAAELGDDADDDSQAVAPGDRPPLIQRATRASSAKCPSWDSMPNVSWETFPLD